MIAVSVPAKFNCSVRGIVCFLPAQVVLGLSALRPDAQEDDIRKIVAKATDEVLAATRCACTVLLHSDPVTNECKGTGIVSIK